MASLGLQEALEAGAVIAGAKDGKYDALKGSSAGKEPDALQWRLQCRLRLFNQLRQHSEEGDKATLFEVQIATGSAALEAIQSIEQASRITSVSEVIPSLGSRDLKVLSTLSSIVANWKIGNEITAFDDATRNAFSKHSQTKLEEIDHEYVTRRQQACTAYSHARQNLCNTIRKIESLLASDGNVREQIMSMCSVSILAAGMRIGWGPSAPGGRCKLNEGSMYAREFVSNLLRKLPTNVCLKILSSAASVGGRKTAATWTKHTTEMLFAAQLLRPDGVMSLLRNTFDPADDNERGLMKRLVSVGQLLSTPPQRMPLDQFAAVITPRLLEVIAPLPTADHALPPSHHSSRAQKNAAAFALARLNEVAHHAVAQSLAENVFRFLDPTYASDAQIAEGSRTGLAVSHNHLSEALELLAELVNQSEPSSGILNDLLKPVGVALFVLSDPAAIQSASILPVPSKGKGKPDAQISSVASDLFRVWLRLADLDEAMLLLFPQRSESLFELEELPIGSVSVRKSAHPHVPALKQGEQGLYIVWAKQERASELPDISKSLLDIRLDTDDVQLPTEWLKSLQQRPSPSHLASCLKEAQRKDVASALLVDLLDVYTHSRQARSAHVGKSTSILQGVLYVQHILQLIDTFGSECLQGDKAKMLAFIVFALGKETKEADSKRDLQEAVKTEMEDMPFIRSASGQDAFSTLTSVSTDIEATKENLQDETDVGEDEEELIETALSLLLSLLESDPRLSEESHSMLHIIAHRVQILAASDMADIRPLAKEAALVLQARRSSSTSKTAAQSSLSTPKEQALGRGRLKYQEALKLLQDPILPVRAHGLIVLKELVAFGTTYTAGTLVVMDPALTLAVLDVFLQAICDDDSYLYLNAVKGLTEMGNTGGKTMIRRLMTIYLASHDAKDSRFTQAEVDKRLRVGEAILQVVQKLDQALAAYVDDIVSPLLVAVREQDTPTTLRASMLSLLGTCVEACPSAMSTQGHSADICEAMLDLLSIETDSIGETGQRETDNALDTNAKLPHLRRAALLLLSLLLRGSSLRLQAEGEQRQDDAWSNEHRQLSALRMPGGTSIQVFPNSSTKRISHGLDILFPLEKLQHLHTIVTYVAQTDSDALTRHQAVEVLQDADMLKLHALHSGIGSD